MYGVVVEDFDGTWITEYATVRKARSQIRRWTNKAPTIAPARISLVKIMSTHKEGDTHG